MPKEIARSLARPLRSWMGTWLNGNQNNICDAARAIAQKVASRRDILIVAGVLKQRAKWITRCALASPSNSEKQSMLPTHFCLQTLSKNNDFAPRHPKSHFTCIKIIKKLLDVCEKRSALIRSAAHKKIVTEQSRNRACAFSKIVTKPKQKQ